MSKLISMVAFIKEQDKLEFVLKGQDYADEWSDFCLSKLDRINDYANFLSQPLTLGMFIPCDENNVPIEQCDEICACECDKMKAYRESKDKVLFEGFFIFDGADTKPTDVKSITNGIVHVYWFNNAQKWYLSKGLNTIENLVKYNITLTKK
jgi:hypothetical protein